jgi:hypothetical protein
MGRGFAKEERTMIFFAQSRAFQEDKVILLLQSGGKTAYDGIVEGLHAQETEYLCFSSRQPPVFYSKQGFCARELKGIELFPL